MIHKGRDYNAEKKLVKFYNLKVKFTLNKSFKIWERKRLKSHHLW